MAGRRESLAEIQSSLLETCVSARARRWLRSRFRAHERELRDLSDQVFISNYALETRRYRCINVSSRDVRAIYAYTRAHTHSQRA